MRIGPQSGAPWIFAALLALIGCVLTFGGAELVLLGGSPYYVLTGLAVIASGVLLWFGKRSGMWLYLAMLCWTAVWAFWEVGLNGWGLAPRLLGPVVLGLYFLIPRVRASLS